MAILLYCLYIPDSHFDLNIGGYRQSFCANVWLYCYIFESQSSCGMLINSFKFVWFKYCGLRFDKFIGTWLIWILLKNNDRPWDSFFIWIISQLSSYWTIYFQETKDRRIEKTLNMYL